MIDGTQNFGSTRRSISFYDVTDITGAGASNPAGVFGQTPLFSIWPGYEDSLTSNFEDPDTIAVNPFNGDVYLLAFDSGTPGTVDAAGDTEGDLDFYRIDFQAVLAAHNLAGNPAGTMYAPTTGPDGGVMIDHPDHVGTTEFVATASTKIGEVGRTQGGSFFDRDLVYFDPETFAYIDNEQDASDTATQDHELRIIGRVSTASGAAAPDASDADSILGGYNSQTSESWGTDRIGVLNMDFVGGMATGFSEPEDIVGVDRDGVRGVWVAETDGGGDDLSFFPLVGGGASGVAAAATTLDLLGNSRTLDEDPELDTTTNDGDHDAITLDENGNVIITESGFFDALVGGEAGSGGTPSGEPSFQRLNVDTYGAADVDLSANVWDDLNGVGFADDAGTPPTQIEGPFGSLTNSFGGGSGLSDDDDTAVTDGRFSTYDPDTKVLYLFDIDSGGLPDVVGDVIGINTETGEIVYEERNAANHFYIEHGIRFFRRGDSDGDGDVDADDIDALVAAGLTGTALDEEHFDLTSDDLVTLGFAAGTDLEHMIHDILGTEFGDLDLNGMVNSLDLSTLAGNLGNPGGWADGDIDGNGSVNSLDLSALVGFLGFSNMGAGAGAGATVVPEPTTIVLIGLAGTFCLPLRRRNRS
jgi:hypothetical protein